MNNKMKAILYKLLQEEIDEIVKVRNQLPNEKKELTTSRIIQLNKEQCALKESEWEKIHMQGARNKRQLEKDKK